MCEHNNKKWVSATCPFCGQKCEDDPEREHHCVCGALFSAESPEDVFDAMANIIAEASGLDELDVHTGLLHDWAALQKGRSTTEGLEKAGVDVTHLEAKEVEVPFPTDEDPNEKIIFVFVRYNQPQQAN